MIDANLALLNHLEAQAGLAGVQILAARNEPPEGYTPADGDCIAFKIRGGSGSYDDDLLFPSFQFKCYAATEKDANDLYLALRNALQHAQGADVVWAKEETLGQTLYEPDTSWPFVLALFDVTIRNN